MNPLGGLSSVDQISVEQWAFFQLQQCKCNGEQSLRHGDYASAFAMYNTAVEYCNMCGPFLNVPEELSNILSNRSLVLSKMGDFGLALTDAQQCIGLNPHGARGYLRSAAAYKGLNNFYEALNILIQGYNVTLPQSDQEIAITFLHELIVTITQLQRHQGDCDSLLAEHEELKLESLETDAQEKLLQGLASSHYWEGVSLLITGEHRGPRSSLDFSIPNVSAKYVSIASLFYDLSISDLKRYGMQLAVALLKNGSPYQDIEEKFGIPALNVVLIKTLETGNYGLIKLFFKNYLDTQEKKDAVDRYGNSALHVIVLLKTCSDEERNNLLLLCIQHGCSALIFDKTEKLPIDYCDHTNKCFESLSRIFNDTETVRRHVLELKEKGNSAKDEKQYEKALLYYTRAIKMSTRCDMLHKDSAILYTNRCTVYAERNRLQEAIKDAELATKMDETWMKGHWRKSQLLRRNGQNSEAFVAAMEGVNISEIVNKDKCELVIESVKSFQYLSDFEKNERYGAFSDVPVDLWPSVLQRLSKEAEWLCIKQLVIGIGQDNEAKGIARNTDFSTIKYGSLFTFIIQQQARKDISSWIVPLIVHITTNPEGSNNLTSFKEWEGDTPLHAAARFSLITGNTSMLMSMDKVPLEMIDQNGNSPLHSVVKVPKPSQFAAFLEVVEKLLQMGVSPDLRDGMGKMAVDYVDKCGDSKIIQLLSKGNGDEDKSLQPLVQQKEHTVSGNKEIGDSIEDKTKLSSEDNKAAKVDSKPSLSDSQDMKNEEYHHSSKSLSKSSDKSEFNLHRNEGDRAFKAKKLKPALESYRKAKNHMDAASKAEKAYFLWAALTKLRIDEAEHFKPFIENSYQAQLRVGKSYAGLRQYKKAFSCLLSAYNLSSSLTDVNMDDLLYEIASVYAVCDNEEINYIQVSDFGRFCKCDWIKALYRLIQNDEWYAAENVYMDLSIWAERFKYSFDLKILCNINKVQKHPWVLQFIIELLDNGSDYHSMFLEKGESFFHACVRLTLATGNMNLLEKIIHPVVRKSEQNIQDSHGNTVLHLAVNQRTFCVHRGVQFRVVQRLLAADVNPLLFNKQKKAVSKCAPRSFPDLIDIIKSREVWKQEEIRKKEEENKRKIQMERQQKEIDKKKHQEYLNREKAFRKERETADASYNQCIDRCKENLENAKQNIKSNKLRLACFDLIKIFNANRHGSDMHKQFEVEGVQLIVDALGEKENPDIPEKLTRIKQKIFLRIVHGLAERKHWKQMHIVVTEYRKYHSPSDLNDFAVGLSVEQVLDCKTYQNKEELLLAVITNMLRSGALLPSDGKHAIETVVQNNHFKILDRLFDFNANPIHLSVEDGDTPIHAALYIALDRDKGNVSLLAKFLEMYQNNSEKYPMLDPKAVNLFGESLFHVVAKAKNNSTTLDVTIMLCEKGVNSNIKDHEGKLPVEYLKSDKDKRLQYFRLASKGTQLKRDSNDKDDNEDHKKDQSCTRKKSKSEVRVHDVPLKKEKLMEEIRRMIESLQDISMYFEEDMKKKRNRHDSISKEQECSSHNQIETKESLGSGIVLDNILDEETKLQIDPHFFESHEWEIECTHEVWSKLLNPALSQHWKIDIIKKLQNLARGEFFFNCCRKIGISNVNAEIEIHESTPILWEIAVCFSSKLSAIDDNCRSVYTEIIRVWDIVENQEKKEEALRRISESISRGEECVVKKYVNCSKMLHQKFAKGKRIPRKYFECSLDTEGVQKLIFPASHVVTEYHILKFYSFTTDMALSALQNMDCKKDFPFKVTETEHSVININSRRPVLLLGRSGTGKTTCCLYRLWNRFDRHWRKEVEQKKYEGNQNEEIAEENIEYNNLQQMFITKNLVLCNEVQKCFRELRNASEIGSKIVPRDYHPLPAKFQDLQNDQFPVFTTSRRLLLTLDASLPDPFFKRDSSGNILVDVPGWTNEDDSLSFLHQFEDNSESESDDSSDEDGHPNTNNDAVEYEKKPDIRKEVNYSIFSNVVWPRINKCNEHYHPSLIWTEIISFIKGSYEALFTKLGYLSKEEYIEHGRKKAPNFTGERETIYEIFLKYKHYLKQHCLFDETDVVRNIFNRMGHFRKDEWKIQEIYVDETQDFTQAELYLLLNICQNPNDMFLTGDTAQSIMRGISFRFKDLRSLFYHAKKSQEPFTDIQIPEKIHQLTHNYRSHTGILWLASSILDILVEYFPESFDPLQKDQGLFQGPAPILLESCDVSDLAVILKGKKQSTSRIEFGAHQAVLVVNDEARDNLPDELQQGIVLTIYEAKGLEFDDILLYNFFKDSQAEKEWRIVTNFLENIRISETNKTTTGKENDSLYEIDYSVFEEEGRPRPLSFDPNRHKVLNSELKHLYTAVTRARVHVWIFDENENKRAPVFEYFKARKLVQAVKDNEGSGDLMFAEESSIGDWLNRGDEFMKKSLYDVAAKCFRLGGDPKMEKIAKSHQKALIASRMQGNSAQIKDTFLSAAHDFLECEVPSMAGRCLEFAKEFSSAAKLYEKTNQFEKAAEIYKKMHLPVEGSRCLELAGKYKQAISLLCDAELFEFAIHCLKRFRIVKKEYDERNEQIPKRLLENPPTEYQTEIQLSYKAADFYHKHGKIDKMMSFLQQLPDLDEKVEFLALRDRTEQVISIIKLSGKEGSRRLVDFYMKQGMAEKALEIAADLGDGILRNRCHILNFNIKLSKTKDATIMDDTEKNEICQRLKEVFYAMQDSKDKILAGRAAFIVGKLNNDKEFVKKAFGAFLNCEPFPSLAGQLECMDWMTSNTNLKVYSNIAKCILGMETLFKALNILIKPINDIERLQFVELLDYYGFHRTSDDKTCFVYPLQRPMALDMKGMEDIEKTKHVCQVNLERARNGTLQFLIENGLKWKTKLENTLDLARCKPFAMFKEFLDIDKFIKILEDGIQSVELEMHISVGSEEIGKRKQDFKVDFKSLKQISFEKCQRLITDMFPVNGISALGHIETGKRIRVLETIRNSKNRFFYRCLTSFLQSLIDKKRMDWKRYHVPRFLCYIFCYDIFNLRRCDNPERALRDIEESVTCELAPCNNDEEMNGFLVSQNIGKSTVVSSVCTEMVISQEYLRTKNPIGGLIHFCKFCDELCQRNIELDSHLWLFLYWLEFYTTISLMSITVLLSKPKEKLREVCIPKSFEQNAETLYLAFSKEGGLIQTLCNKQILKMYEKDLLKSPASLSKLLCGTESKSSLLDILFLEKNTLRERQILLHDLDVLSQRILLISLVIFCNLGRGFHGSKKIEEEMALKLCSGRWQKHTSEQVKETFKTLRDKKQTCPGNFQDALLSLVFERENDSLRCFGYTQDKNSFFVTLFDESKYRQKFLSKETIKIVKNPTANLESKKDEQFQVHEVKKGDLLDIPNMRDGVSEKEHGIPSNRDMKSDNVTNPGEKAEEDTNVREQKIVEKKIDSDNKSIDETKSNNTGSRNDNAANVIIRFWRSFIFNRKVVDLCKHLRKQIIREKNIEIEERFTCLEMDATIFNVCGIPFKSNANITTSKNEVMLYERVNGGDYEKPDVLSEEFIITCPDENKHFVDNEIQDNPFQLLLKNDSKNNNLNLENKGEHETSESHQKKFQEFEIFKEKFYSEVYDTIRGIERFIEIYNLRDEETLKSHSDMSDYIGCLCDENMYLDELVNKIIRDRDWCNRDIEEKVKNVCFILSSIKDGVKRTALENKKKMQTSGSIDTEGMGLNNKKTKKGKTKFIPTGKFTFSSM